VARSHAYRLACIFIARIPGERLGLLQRLFAGQRFRPHAPSDNVIPIENLDGLSSPGWSR
jgi:hypothetical protein